MGVTLYPKPVKRKLDLWWRDWHVRYNLAYDGGGSEWTGYYRTYRGAKIAAWWNVHVMSWGGSAYLMHRHEDKRREDADPKLLEGYPEGNKNA